MQMIFHEYRNKHRIFGMMESLYQYVSDYDYKFEDILWLDESFKELYDILYANLYLMSTITIKHFDLPKIDYQYKNHSGKEVVVCLSGGKDSAACAKHYLNKGYKVHLYHALNINRSYPDEKIAAQKIADYLGCDIFFDALHLKGSHKFIEHPMKNYLIANGALHYAMAKGYPPVIAFGNFNQSHLVDNAFDVCAGDCIDMWNAYEKIIQSALPDFQMRIPLTTNADSFNLIGDDVDLLNLTISCMSPYRFRATWKHNAEQKYNIKMLNNRCGSCWKDCLESMWLMDIGKMIYCKPFYKHCIEILIRTVKKESDLDMGIKEVWDNYMFYPIENSHAIEFL